MTSDIWSLFKLSKVHRPTHNLTGWQRERIKIFSQWFFRFTLFLRLSECSQRHLTVSHSLEYLKQSVSIRLYRWWLSELWCAWRWCISLTPLRSLMNQFWWLQDGKWGNKNCEAFLGAHGGFVFQNYAIISVTQFSTQTESFHSLAFTILLQIIAFLYQICKKDDIIKFLQILHEFDIKAKSLEVQLNMNATKTTLLKIISFYACGIFVVSVGTALLFEFHPQYGGGYTMPLSYGYILVYLSLLILQFSFATLAIKTRFSLLNENLRFTFQNISTVRNSSINIHSIGWSENLPSIITDLYGRLCDCIDLVNDSFTFQLIPFMVYYLTANLFAIYSMIREAFYQTPLMFVACGVNIWWILLHNAIISIALYSGYTTTRCALKTPIIVSSIVKSRKWSESRCTVKVFKTFLVEVLYRNIFFENEFVRIDWKLLFTVSHHSFLSLSRAVIKNFFNWFTCFQMISTITTFLVITCQFDASMGKTQATNSTLD